MVMFGVMRGVYMEKEKTIYDLKLFESYYYSIDTYKNIWLNIRRVPGGWIFETRYQSDQILSSVFVPYNSEFDERGFEEIPF